MKRQRSNLSAPLALAAFCTGAAGLSAHGATSSEETLPDKGVYNLFHPTPAEDLRELSADRPDKTESPQTVDAGHFQLEMDFVSYAHDRGQSGGGDLRRDDLAVAPINLKLGLLNNVDVQLLLETYNYVRINDQTTGKVEKNSGFGDTTLRVKVNAWGNDRGSTALAVMPFVRFPSNQDGLGGNSIQGGLIVPFGVSLPHGWDLGFTSVFAFVREDTHDDFDTLFANSITVGHDLWGNLAAYVEFYGEVTAPVSPWVGTVDFGFTYGLTADLQLDAGVNIGVTDPADDVNPFVGMTWRF